MRTKGATLKRLTIVSLFVVVLWYNNANIVWAQSPIPHWSEPRLLSNPEVDAWRPTIAADRAGNVHIMFSETLTDDPPPGEGDTLVYTRWDGRQWSSAVDVLVSPDGAAEYPDQSE